MTTTLIVPGLNSSGSAHWQTWFEQQLPDAIRVIQADWKRADLPEWSSRIRRAIVRQPAPVLIAAHSFGALAALQAADDLAPHVAGLLLVAPADPDKFNVTDMLPSGRVDVPTTLVASTNDRWLSFHRAAALADHWGAELVDLGAAGHVNAESGYGPWPQGLELLARLESESALTRIGHASKKSLIRHEAERFAARSSIAGRSRDRTQPWRSRISDVLRA